MIDMNAYYTHENWPGVALRVSGYPQRYDAYTTLDYG